MSTNGHFSTVNIDGIMDEWYEITNNTRAKLCDSILEDSQKEAERELDMLVTVLIPGSFQFGGGSVPNAIYEEDAHYLWDCSRFSKVISERAKEAKKTTRRFLEVAFEPWFEDRREDTPIEALKRTLLLNNGRERMIKRILGEEELLRIKSKKIFKDGIQKVTKKHSSDSLKDQEEVKSPAFTQDAS